MYKKENKSPAKLNWLDTSLLVIFLVSLMGFGLARAGHAGVNQILKGQSMVTMDIYFIGLKTNDTNLFKIGDSAALTIRNQPVYPPMKITAIKHWPKQAFFYDSAAKKGVCLPDLGQPYAHDFLVSVSDQADVTNDGYVIRGNKIKIGNQVELEGFKYRVQGVVVDIRPQP